MELLKLKAGGEDEALGCLQLSDDDTASRDRRLFHCKECGQLVTDWASIRAAPGGGERQVFANPHGRVFEIVRTLRVHRVALVGEPTTEASWFGGYAWTIASCGRCGSHLGWRFTAAVPAREPSVFWGLLVDRLVETGSP